MKKLLLFTLASVLFSAATFSQVKNEGIHDSTSRSVQPDPIIILQHADTAVITVFVLKGKHYDAKMAYIITTGMMSSKSVWVGQPQYRILDEHFKGFKGKLALPRN